MRHGVRTISADHHARLRAFVARTASARVARTLLRTGPETMADALTGKAFRIETVERLEAAIDELVPPAAEERAS